MDALFRNYPPVLEVVKTNGSTLTDKNGKTYLDFMMGWNVGNAGWGKSEIRDPIKGFDGPEYVTPVYAYQPWETLAKKLVSLSFKGRCFRATGGTEAVEIAMKIARAHNKRKKFIAFENAYHGQSYACMSLVGLHENMFGPYSSDYIRMEPKDWEATTAAVVKRLKTKEVCAYISEPFLCNLGVIVPPKEFFKEVREVCTATDTVMIIDEVATGFGRTGTWFGFEHQGIEPDIITIAKGFSSGYGALGSVIAKPEIAEVMHFPFSNYSTFGWHPYAVQAALANIAYIEKHHLVEQSKKSGEYLMKKAASFSPEGKGLCVGFAVKDEAFEAKCREKGLILSSFGGRAMLYPALDVTKKDIDSAINILHEVK